MRKRVLWVDDEIEFLRSHVVFLETRGYAVTTASGGDEAIRQIRGAGCDAFDIVLLDKQMPVKSGAATLEEIKELCPNLPVVMITGYQHAADTALKKKFDGYLTKPVDSNKLLQVCKQIIDSKQQASIRLSDRYLRAYTEIQSRLSRVLSAADWMEVYAALTMWDIELDGAAAGGEGVRQAHTGLKSDCSKAFCDFAVENYAGWVRGSGGGGRPLMSVDVLEKAAVPEFAGGRSVLMVMLNGLRLDQFLTIEPLIRKTFTVRSALVMSTLPTVSNIGTITFASGMYHSAAAEIEPALFSAPAGENSPVVMKRLMCEGLKRTGVENVKTYYADVGDVNGQKNIQSAVSAIKKAQTFGVVTFDIMEKFIKPGSDLSEAALREQISSWFTGSPILAMMREACRGNCTVILASAHGHIKCVRASEIYEVAKINAAQRCLFGNDASGDDREVFLLEDMAHFGLPQTCLGTKCLMARENYYFKTVGKNPKNRDNYQYGGISFEEMITPLYICQ